MENAFARFAVGPVVERIDDRDGERSWEVSVDHQLKWPQSSKVSLFVSDDSDDYILVPDLAHEALSDTALVEQGVWLAVDSLDAESLGATSIVHGDREHWIITGGTSFSPATFLTAVCETLYSGELGRRIHACLKRDLDERHAGLLAQEADTHRRFIEQIGQAAVALTIDDGPTSVTGATVLDLIERASRRTRSLRATIPLGWNRAASAEAEERDEISAQTTAMQVHLDELERMLVPLVKAYESLFGEVPTSEPVPLEVTFTSTPFAIQVIRIVRAVTGLGLEEAQELMASVGVDTPQTVLATLVPAKVRDLQRQLAEHGGELTFRAR